jgi:hypothetical protein
MPVRAPEQPPEKEKRALHKKRRICERHDRPRQKKRQINKTI